MSVGHQAYGIRLANGRYFVKFGKDGRICSAWSLSGAKLECSSGFLEEVERKLAGRGLQYERIVVGVAHSAWVYPKTGGRPVLRLETRVQS